MRPRNAKDLVALYTHTGGNLTKEQYYGGDLPSQALGTRALCGLGLPASDVYRLGHTYAAGALATSEYKTSSGGYLLFRSVDQTIDPATGLVATSKDISGSPDDHLRVRQTGAALVDQATEQPRLVGGARLQQGRERYCPG